MHIISFMNMKGGVGKTTIAVNIAYALADLHKKKVLIVDCDPQFNATQCLVKTDAYLKHIQDQSKGTLKDIFIPRSHGPVNTLMGSSKGTNKAKMALSACTINIFSGLGGAGRLDLIPSILDLVEVQNSRRQTENRLKSYIKEKAAGYDYVLIDCPPTISIFTEAAILASDGYVVPIRPDPLSVIGLPLLERYIQDYTVDFGTNIKQIGIIFTQVRRPTPQAMAAVMDDLKKQRKDAVFPVVATVSTNVAESVAEQRPVFRFKKASDALKMQYVNIAAEFQARVGG
jgi:chromosome partitioning protein